MLQKPHSGIDYFSRSEQKHLDEFMKTNPNSHFWFNPKGKKPRKIVKVELPFGMRTKETIEGPPLDAKQPFGPRYYHTPRATNTYHKEAIIFFQEDGEEPQSCTSKEWMEWLGNVWDARFEDTDPDKTPVPVKIISEMELGKASIYDSEPNFKDLKPNEKPQWKKATARS